MLVTTECIPCYLQQSINAMEKGEVDKQKRSALLKELFPLIMALPEDRSPAENSTIILHKLVELIGGYDPFEKAKKASNQQALAYLGQLEEMVKESKDPLLTALKISVAGNVVDLGIFDDYDLSSAIKDAMKSDFSIDDYRDFKEDLEKGDKVLIIGDNSGEIVFDKILVKQLMEMGKEVIYGVKGGFIINDATIDDAKEAGLTDLVKVITNGNNFLGTIEKYCSREFLEWMHDSNIIISKGQANYESLESSELAGDNTYFLLKAKCPVVAAHLGVDYGNIVLVKNRVKAVFK